MGTFLQNVRGRLSTPAKNPTLTAVAVSTLAFSMVASSALAGATAVSGGASEPNSALAARWEGAAQIPGTELRMVIDLAQNSEGNWIGSAIIPGRGVKGMALTDIAVNNSEVAFVIKGVLGNPKLKGHLDEKGALTGEFQEAGNSAPFVLEKTGPPQVEPPRRSTTVRKELEGVWQGEFALPGRTVYVQVTLANQVGGPATAKCHVKGKNEFDLPVEFVTDEDNLITLESPSIGFLYQGWFHRDSNEIGGEFQLGPYDDPLVLRPAAKNPAEPKS
jgi:hypothetical protein